VHNNPSDDPRIVKLLFSRKELMARCILIPCLSFALVVSGCADRQEIRSDPQRELADALATPPPTKRFLLGNWLEEHPGVKDGLKYTGIGALAVVGVAVVYAGLFAGLLLLAHPGMGSMH
jgi:hypothetical protein